ncbi:MAG: DUF4249 domain-containing protein [Saprospirales bacterium]|nr:DUF4249 domain-containing protein [Saprospirales bacterium]MBK8922154.1 DUF4249 domain-containing protein [Saprospirales bacterium]
MNAIKYILSSLALIFLAACNLEKEVDIELPGYERQPVVECYLEPGKPFRLLLTQSYGFFDPFGLDSSFLQKTLLDGATVTISYNGQVDTLRNLLSVDPSPLKIFNYSGQNLVPATPGMVYDLNIILPDGKTIDGQATLLPFVPIDSIKVEWNAERDTLARVLTYISDDPGQENFYRRMLNYATLDSIPEQDFLANDRIATTNLIAFGTGYELVEGDTVINTIFHISREYYNYIESVQLAVIGNLNPFAQPSPIKSNVRGSANPLGIFTCLVYDRDTTIIHR